jgi:hypothetical protein
MTRFALCEFFGWTLEYVKNLSLEDYNDSIHYVNKVTNERNRKK